MRRFLLALGLVFAGLLSASAQSVDIAGLPLAVRVADGDLLIKYDSTQVSGQRTQKLPIGSLAAYIVSKIPVGPAGPMGPVTSFYAGTTTTLPAGAQATVVVTGTAPQQYINIGVPAGQQGVAGVPGPAGPTGLTGVQGLQGPIGTTGAQGPAGPAGPIGPQGNVGATGQTGPPNSLSIGSVTSGTTASATISGTAPAQTLSFVLQKGDTGPTGATGATGAQGQTGATGATGPQGVAGQTGAIGSAGPQGAMGVPGTQGPQGVQGPKGDTGATGATGPQGAPGTGAGNVNTSGTPRTGAFAVYSDTTGKNIQDGGIPAAVATSGSASDLAAGTLPAARLPALTGDVTTSAGSTATTLASSGVTAGTYGAANTVPVLTVDAKGRVTSASTAATGTVTSVALALPSSLFTVSGSPVTGSGTLTGTLATQSPNTVLAGPSSGSTAATPTLRSLVAADLPTSGVTAGSAVLPSVTVDAYGRVTALSQSALTGDVTTSAGSLATTIAANAVTNAKLAQAPTATIKGNATGSAASPSDLTPAQAKTLLGFASSGSNSDITALSGLTTALSVGQGGTAATTAAGARSNLGAAASGANSDITSLASPALGSATATTQAAGDSSTKVATDAFVLANGGGGAPSAVNAQSSAYTVTSADKGKTLLLTGSFTVTEPACSSNAGLYFFVKKADGSGVVALKPASGTTDGLASKNVYEEDFLEWCDGTNWRSQGRPKGWINVGSTTVSTSVSAVSFTTGFSDAELRDMQFDFEGVTNSNGGNDNLVARVVKSGTNQTSGYLSYFSYFNASSVAASGSGSYIAMGLAGTNTAGTLTLHSFAQVNGQGRIEGSTIVDAGYASVFGARQSTAAAITSLSFAMSTYSVAGGTFNQKAFRP